MSVSYSKSTDSAIIILLVLLIHEYYYYWCILLIPVANTGVSCCSFMNVLHLHWKDVKFHLSAQHTVRAHNL